MKKILYEDVNIKRTGKYIDNFFDQNKILPSGHPLFFHIEFSINGTCNRRCFFCPRVDPKKYPNITTALDIKVFEKMVLELKEVKFNGRISFSGFGEPLLTKNLYQYIEIVKKTFKRSLYRNYFKWRCSIVKKWTGFIKEIIYFGFNKY